MNAIVNPTVEWPLLVRLHMRDIEHARQARQWGTQQFGEPKAWDAQARWTCHISYGGQMPTVMVARFRCACDQTLWQLMWG